MHHCKMPNNSSLFAELNIWSSDLMAMYSLLSKMLCCIKLMIPNRILFSVELYNHMFYNLVWNYNLFLALI